MKLTTQSLREFDLCSDLLKYFPEGWEGTREAARDSAWHAAGAADRTTAWATQLKKAIELTQEK